eukprot:2892696-Pyramimonas_sp.AAC.1
MKLMLLHPVGEMVAKFGAVAPAIVVDDLVLQRWGSTERVQDDLVGATRHLVQHLKQVKLKIAVKKSRVLGNTGVRSNISRRLLKVAGVLGARHARNLGIDHAEGRRATRAIRQQRFANVELRMGKVRSFLGLRKGRTVAAKVAYTGMHPSALYGVNCTGLNESELSKMRSITVIAVEARPAGKSATAVLILSGARTLDPVFAAALGPAMMLARAVWEQ